MRRVFRAQLGPDVESDLRRRQSDTDRRRAEGTLDVEREWSNARKTTPLRAVAATLKSMMSPRERCMYCLDSHGTDVDHFWPKRPYPERMFVWPNLLLSCTECGRLKGDRFPLVDGQPALVDPTAEDPWQHLDFDPTTGNVIARFDPQANDYSARGMRTVDLLQLDKREALSEGYKRTLRRLSKIVERALARVGPPDTAALCHELQEADDHGLIEWCFFGSGRDDSPFRELRTNHARVWGDCSARLRPHPGE
jgi:uncharacterized protein (TIGR02646 family)